MNVGRPPTLPPGATQLAQMAALHATPRQLTELRRIADAMHTASTWQAYEDLDAAFHDLIAESAGNALLHDLHKIMNGVRMIFVFRDQLYVELRYPYYLR